MIYSFLYVVIFSMALILIQKLDMSIPPLFSLLVTASIATVYFNFINKKNIKKMYASCLKSPKEWFTIMFIVLVMWGTTMIGPGKIGASLFNFIYFAWLGGLGFILLGLREWKESQTKFYLGACLFLLIALNVFFELRYSLSFDSVSGIVSALVGGTASFIYFKKSQLLARNTNLSATQILAVRFYLAILVLLIILPKSHVGQYLTFNNTISLIILAFFSLIIPLYFSQKALEKISSEQHAIINSLCPLVTGVLQEIYFHDLKSEQMIIYFLYSLAIASFYFINKLDRKMVVSK